jgi:uncharacterized protein YhaN
MANDVGQALLQGIDKLNARFDRVESRLATIEGAVADIDGRLKSWPDMHYLSAAAKVQVTHTREMMADVAAMKVRMDEIYQAMATDPEVRSLREDVARFRDQSLNLDVRISTIEGHLGLDGRPTPPSP